MKTWLSCQQEKVYTYHHFDFKYHLYMLGKVSKFQEKISDCCRDTHQKPPKRVSPHPGRSTGFWQQDPYSRYLYLRYLYLRYLCLKCSYLRYLYLRYLYLRYLYLRYSYPGRILYLGYHIYDINIADMTRYLCQFVGWLFIGSITTIATTD